MQCRCICICTCNTVPSAIELLSSNYLESSSYRWTISQLKSLGTLRWMWDPLTIAYNDNMMTMMMMVMVMMMTLFWWWKGLNWVKRSEILCCCSRQLHCLLNLDNLRPADGKINWKWISNAEMEIQTGVKYKYAWGSCPRILSSLSRKISILTSSCTEC